MFNEPSSPEVIANKTGVEPDQYLKDNLTELKKSFPLQNYLMRHFKIGKLMSYWLPLIPEYYRKTLAGDLQLGNSCFWGHNIYPVPEIPQIHMDDCDTSPDIQMVFDEFPFFTFGGVSFKCTHEYIWNEPKKGNAHAKDMFEIRYGIKLSDVYISLNELNSVASLGALFSVIDDFFVTGNHDNTVLTVLDNDLPYGAQGSTDKHECHFKPVFCIDQGIPVKYIKTVADDKSSNSRQYMAEQRHRYAEQRTHTLKKLGEFYKINNLNDNSVIGYPTDLDFIVKTGLREFCFLSYDRSSAKGNFFITNVRYDNNGNDLKYIIKKCNIRQLSQIINTIQCARAQHFNKMYGPKGR